MHRKSPIKGFPGKCEQILSFFRICSHLPKKSVMESFVFMCRVNIHFKCFFLTFNVNFITLHKKTKFSIKNFVSKCDQIRSSMRIWSHLLKKSLMKIFIFCAELLLPSESFFILRIYNIWPSDLSSWQNPANTNMCFYWLHFTLIWIEYIGWHCVKHYNLI